MNTIEWVAEFHKKFNRPINTKITINDIHLNVLRLRLLREEINELELALQSQNTIEVLDALTDLQYILDGTYLSFGLQNCKDMAFLEVHQSNMTKDGKIRDDGKVLKGPSFIPPNLKPIIERKYA